MKKLLMFGFFYLLLTSGNCQKMTLDELFKLNSKDVGEFGKIVSLKGYSLMKSGEGAWGAYSETWLSNYDSSTLFFRVVKSGGKNTSLAYSPITLKEYTSFEKQALTRGFKRVPYENSVPEKLELINYKKGKLEITFFTKDKSDKPSYSVAVSD